MKLYTANGFTFPLSYVVLVTPIRNNQFKICLKHDDLGIDFTGAELELIGIRDKLIKAWEQSE